MSKRATMLMRVLSWASKFTPNTVYYPEDLAITLNGTLAEVPMDESGLEGCPLGSAAIAVAALSGGKLPTVGDTFLATIHGMTHGGDYIGSFRVHIERIGDEEEE